MVFCLVMGLLFWSYNVILEKIFVKLFLLIVFLEERGKVLVVECMELCGVVIFGLGFILFNKGWIFGNYLDCRVCWRY